MAIYSQNFTWKADCERAGEELKAEFAQNDMTIKTKCIQVR
jgi:hypothetical protein